MIEKVIYKGNQGLGIIMDESEDESNYIGKTNIIINGVEITPGQKTTLFGMFDQDVTYCGILKDDPANSLCMVFLLGNHADLFDHKRYYACFYWITPTRILNIYKEGSARDFIYVDGKWK